MARTNAAEEEVDFQRMEDVTLQEVKAFVGVILEMGLIQLSDIK